MKRIIAVLGGLLLVIALAACSDSDDDAMSESEVIEASVEDASYVLTGQDNGELLDDEDGGLLKIDLQIKNISDTSLQIFPEMDMQLYDGENQIDPSTKTNPNLGLQTDSNGSVGPDKQKTVSVMFNVDKDTEYDVNIKPQSEDPETKPKGVSVPIDTSKYSDSLEEMENPAKALEAYIETLYLDKDNSDYEKFVSADKNDIQDEAEEQFGETLEMGLSAGASDDEIEKNYERFKEASAEKDDIDAQTIGYVEDQAVVQLDYSALSYEDLNDKLRDYAEEYSDKHEGYNSEKEDDYALSKFDTAIDEMEPKTGQRDLQIDMIKKDGKWHIDNSDIDYTDRIMKIFARGVVS